MLKTASLTLALLATTAAPALADERIPADALAPIQVIYQLLGQGHDLRGLEFNKGIYRADIRTKDGRIVSLGVDPRSGELLPHAFLGRQRNGHIEAVPVSAADAVQKVAGDGHHQVVELEFKNDIYKVKARDDAGALARYAVDARTGALSGGKHARD